MDALRELKTSGVADTNVFNNRRIRERDVEVLLTIDQAKGLGKWLDKEKRAVDYVRLVGVYFCEALDAVGDPYAIMGYTSRGAKEGFITSFKDFAQSRDESVDFALGLLSPLYKSRTGVVYKHFAEIFGERSSQRKIHIDLVTNLANDVDYNDQDAIIDTIEGARLERVRGIDLYAVCLDKAVPKEILQAVYGSGHFKKVDHPENLPQAVLQVYKTLALQ